MLRPHLSTSTRFPELYDMVNPAHPVKPTSTLLEQTSNASVPTITPVRRNRTHSSPLTLSSHSSSHNSHWESSTESNMLSGSSPLSPQRACTISSHLCLRPSILRPSRP
ncbi:hypothetical protein M501DRAFT_1000911 [Patellaria atrata CBS 101060]|uniref:Uncharacterized protein n=1 Tax=Patellaria atrata CBS 101060 TaxID=1346257 RepID=A0A9P4SF04_9PEZI|nr:hypothetical protein M501DRAFT_1000911 [Patellaria atrata CBS 101060]